MEFPGDFVQQAWSNALESMYYSHTPYSDNPVESLIWPNSHGSCSSLAKSNVCYNGAYINFLILFLSINFRGHKYTIVGGNPFCQLLKAMLSFM